MEPGEWDGGGVTDIKTKTLTSHIIKYMVCMGTGDNFVEEEQNDLSTRVFSE